MSPIAIVPWYMQQHNEPGCPLSINLGKINLKRREVNIPKKKSNLLSARIAEEGF
jgi:hypothetical protein